MSIIVALKIIENRIKILGTSFFKKLGGSEN
ncbi:MAG: hypothetical protein A4E56_03178 [Pelotomaculum sp. PtaU1.Bin065]|nr:MAG: hypothetical protein A4E56_03178 [Pelotomaculum sp. PtaU1.Bin065]